MLKKYKLRWKYNYCRPSLYFFVAGMNSTGVQQETVKKCVFYRKLS
jgi:hypothetical protein